MRISSSKARKANLLAQMSLFAFKENPELCEIFSQASACAKADIGELTSEAKRNAAAFIYRVFKDKDAKALKRLARMIETGATPDPDYEQFEQALGLKWADSVKRQVRVTQSKAAWYALCQDKHTAEKVGARLEDAKIKKFQRFVRLKAKATRLVDQFLSRANKL